MKCLNKVMIIGSVGREPEMRYMPNGRAVTSFNVATTRSWTNAEGQRREETEWFNVIAWGSLAEICKQHLHTGQQVYVEGRLQTRRWEDQEGKKYFRTEIVAEEMIVMGNRRAAAVETTELAAGDGGEEFPF